MSLQVIHEVDRLDSTAYQRLSLVGVLRLVVDQDDRSALHEFHNHRPVFQTRDGMHLRLVEYVDQLRCEARARSLCGYDDNVIDRAYDLVIDKFGHLPAQKSGESVSIRVKQNGPDCRYYLRAYIDYIARQLERVDSPLQQEMIATRGLQAFVNRHFLLSCLECRRRARRTAKRYLWKTDGSEIRLWMPSYMSPQQCRSWLEANVPDTDASRPGEKMRIQSIIDERLHTPRIIRFSELGADPDRFTIEPANPPWQVLHEVSTRGLAEAVAREKMDCIDQQRPAIQTLGRAKLFQMIQRIFEDLSADDYHDGVIAREYGLSKATFSRFAGSRWRSTRLGQASGIPDLWRNTAQVLAAFPSFIDGARESGMLHEESRLPRGKLSS